MKIQQSHSWACIWTKLYLKTKHVHCESTVIKKDTRIPAALFTRAKTWKQPKCPITDEWIKTWYTYTMEHYSAIRNNEIMPFPTTRKQLEILILGEVKSERETQLPYDITYMWHLNLGTNNPLYKTESDSQTQRTDLWLPRGRGEVVGCTGSMGLGDANYYV